MKKAVLFFTIIAALVFAGDRLLGFFLLNLYEKNLKGMSGGDINYYLASEKVDVLALGSSRSRQHLIPDSIGISCFNLSHNGMGLGFQAALADILDQRKKFPAKIVLLQIESDVIFANDNSIRSDLQYLKFYYSSNPYLKAQIDLGDRFECVKQYASCYKFNGQVPSLIKNAVESVRFPYVNKHKGFEGSEPSPHDSLNTRYSYRIARRYSMESKDAVIAKALGWKYLKHIKSLCDKNGALLVCYTAPYFGKTGKEALSVKTNEILTKEGINYFDFSKEPIPALASPFLWKDWTHLNVKGARIFSQILNDSLKAQNLY